MFDGIDVHGLFRAPVILEIRLAIASQVGEAKPDGIGNRELKKPVVQG